MREPAEPGAIGADDTDIVVAGVHFTVECDAGAVRGPRQPDQL